MSDPVFPGRFFDGKSAAEHAVSVHVEGKALVIAGDGIALTWRRSDIEATQNATQVRLASKRDPDARLVLSRDSSVEAELRRFGVIGPARAARRAFVFGASLLSASAILVLIIFVGAPMAAEPLARATPPHVEVQLGENLQRQAFLVLRPCQQTEAADVAIDPLVSELSEVSGTPFDVQITFVRTDIPNALTLPGGRVMVTSGLLDTLEQPDELAAVLAHELGHVHARDSMVSLYRNAGLGIFLETVTGGTGIAQQLVLLAGQLTELRYTREQEEQADAFALRTMANAGYDPEALARAFERIGGRVEEIRATDLDIEAPEWLLTHPNLTARIERARAAAAPAHYPTLSSDAWASVRGACSISAN